MLIRTFLFLSLAANLVANPIASSNLFNWKATTGIVGGIPYRTNIYALLSASATTADLSNAMANCPAEGVVLLSNGVFNIGTIYLKNDIEVRGLGTNTIIDHTAAIYEGYGAGRVTNNISSGSTKGSTRVVLANTISGLSVGDMVWISETNNTFASGVGFELGYATYATYLDTPDLLGIRTRGQGVRVTGISGTALSFYPPLEDNYTIYPMAEWASTSKGWGFNNLQIRNYTTHSFFVNYAMDWYITNCWIVCGKNDYPMVKAFWTHRANIQGNVFVGADAGASAIVPYVKNEGWLIENNIFTLVNQVFIKVGPGGRHIFAYNYVHDITNTTTSMINDVGTHGGTPEGCLFEGNVFFKYMGDTTHGTSRKMTLNRNQIKGRKSGSTYGHGMVWLDHTNWEHQVVGNYLGQDGINTNDYGWLFELSSDGSTAPPASIITYRYGYSGYYPWTTDPVVKPSTLRHGNYNSISNQYDWDGSISDRTIPASYYLTNKPGFFGNLPWPGIGPGTQTGTNRWANAAMYRFYNGFAYPPTDNTGSRPIQMQRISRLRL